jgi:arabinofuranosyltransferase
MVPGITVALMAVVLIRTAWLSDDAYITFRTVDNFVNGYGLRWNPAERVQSYTHPLWVLLVSSVYFFTREPYYTGIWLSIALSLSTVFLYSRCIAATPALAVLGAIALTSSRAFVDYSTSGLENALTHLLLTVLLILLWSKDSSPRRPFFVFFVASLALVNRIDVAPLVAPVLLAEAFHAYKARRMWPAMAGAAPFVAWEAFSLFYYGAPFPNTAYAKLNTGISHRTLASLGALYYRDSLTNDPVTVPVIWIAVLLAMRDRAIRPLAIGLLLYGVYILWIGGDFMSGRFLTAPLLIAVALLTRRAWPRRGLVPAVAVTMIALSFVSPRPSTFVSGPDYGHSRAIPDLMNDVGVADERAVYYPTTGLMRALPEERSIPKHYWSRIGIEMRERAAPVEIYPNVGFVGFFAGPSVHIIDCNALTDPLLARLPVDTAWRIGHFGRQIPAGYPRSVAERRNVIDDPELAAFYDHLSLIVSGPLWSPDRLRKIVRLNTGAYAHLADGRHRTEPTICDLY